jgi:hypothetical protein
MTEEYAIREVPARRRMGDSRSSLRFLLPCVLAVALMGCGGEATKEKAPAVPAAGQAESGIGTLPAKITVETPVVDLGEIGMNCKVSGKFTFVNSSQATLRIVKVHTCCGVTVRGVENGQEYAPGERGTLEFTWVVVSDPQPSVVKVVRMETNDPDQKFVSLKIKASVVQRVETDPTRLRLFLRQENAGCGGITIRSLDGKPFSIMDFKSTAGSMSAQFDPNVKATEFVLKPQADVEKLRQNVRGVVSIDLNHPECSNVRVPYDVLPEFTISPALLMVLHVRPEQPFQKDVFVSSNYRDEFEIESVSSQKGYMKLAEKKKVGDRYELKIEITPPARDIAENVTASPSEGQNPPAGAQESTKNTLVADVLEVKIKDGETLSIPFRGFYEAQ